MRRWTLQSRIWGSEAGKIPMEPSSPLASKDHHAAIVLNVNGSIAWRLPWIKLDA
jgi:hypothetical protein